MMQYNLLKYRYIRIINSCWSKFLSTVFIKTGSVKKCNLILLVFLSALSINTFAQDYYFRNFNDEAGLAQPFIYSVAQDDKGYLWISTGEGLSKFDGFSFTFFSKSDSLADNFITCSISNGAELWFGHMNGRVTFYDGKEFHSFNLPVANASPVTHFEKSPAGEIWLSTFSGGLYKFDKLKKVFESIKLPENQLINTFLFFGDGELLLGSGSGLKHYRTIETGHLLKINPVDVFPESKVTGIRRARNGSGFYISTENDGVFFLKNTTQLSEVSEIITDSASFEFTAIQNILEDSQSNLWIASFGQGLIKLVPSGDGKMKITCLNKSTGFPANNVKTVFEDLEGNIWSGNYGDGLTQILPRTFYLFKYNKELYGNSVFSICLTPGFRWLGTERGLLKTDQITGNLIKFYDPVNGLPKDTVTALFSGDGNELFIGTNGNGVFRMKTKTGKIEKLRIGEGTLENSVTSITGSGEQVWIGTKKGICNLNSATGSIYWYSINNGGLPHNYINNLFPDSEKRIWISSKSGTLAYLQNGKVVKIPLVTGLTFMSFTEDMESRIWVGSNGNGVFLIESDTVTNLTTKEGILSDYCYSLVSDNNQNVWIGHKGGLSRIRTTDFSVKQVKQIEDISGDCRFNPNAVLRDTANKIWFGSEEGLIAYDPSKEYPYMEPPVLSITSVRVNDVEKGFEGNKLILGPGRYRVMIDFLGISLKEPSLVTYQYQLQGFGRWSDISGNTSAAFDNLTDGEYNFILKASSGDGSVSTTSSPLHIIIKKPLWRKWWFYILVASLLAMLLIVEIKMREKRFLKEKRILEDKVNERTIEIQNQKHEIELQRDEINTKNASLTSSIRYASYIQNAILPPYDLIDKLLPDNFILFKPKDIVSGDFFWVSEKGNKIIFAVADCTGHGVPGAFMSLLGMTLLNEIVNYQGITISNVILTALREKVIKSLRQNRKAYYSSDGMDIALCVLDKHHKNLQFTGAGSDIVLISDGNLKILKADNLDVSLAYGNKCQFSIKEISVKKGDMLYLFSDGFQDQFGGSKDKKFLRRRFYNTLLEIHRLPLSDQHEILDARHLEWMQHRDQTDDITVMGIRL